MPAGTRRFKLTDAQIVRARMLLDQEHWSYGQLSSYFKVNRKTMRRVLDPAYDEQLTAERRIKYVREEAKAAGSPRMGVAGILQIPDAVLEERERVYSKPITIDMELLGDPLLGRSALDRLRRDSECVDLRMRTKLR